MNRMQWWQSYAYRLFVLLVLPQMAFAQSAQAPVFPGIWPYWTITPDTAEVHGYKVELLPRGLFVVRVEFPVTIEDGFEDPVTKVWLPRKDGEDAMSMLLQSDEVAGHPDRKFFSLAGDPEWLACLRVVTSYVKPDPTRPFTSDTSANLAVEIDVRSFLEAAEVVKQSEAVESPVCP